MTNDIKGIFLQTLSERFGTVRKLAKTQSLFEIGDRQVLVYTRYSKLHTRNQCFYGLRKKDLQVLEGRPAILCFLWDGQKEPLLLPFSEFEEVFQSVEPADDGQYKVQIYLEEQGVQLYVPKAGRFNVESYFGWNALEAMAGSIDFRRIPDLSHPQVQTLLGAIGATKGYEVWVPQVDRLKLDWNVAARFDCREILPRGYATIENIVQEVDVIWLERGSNELKALFEIEHSTPIYSGLLRLNDVHLVSPNANRRFSVVANDMRRALFVRQLNRPTFRTSGLSELCTFLEYYDVYGWYSRIRSA